MTTNLASKVIMGRQDAPVKVMFLEITLKVGGAERLLANLLESFDPQRVQPVVAFLRDPGPVAESINLSGIKVYSNLAAGRSDPRLVPALINVMRKERPDIVYMCNYPLLMFTGRLAGLITGANTQVVALHSIGYQSRARWRTLSLKLMKRFISTFVAVSQGQKDYYVKTHGLDPKRIEVIYVGIDTERFSPTKYESARPEFNIPEEAPVAGIVAMLRPEKNHELLLRAARIIRDGGLDAYFLIVGDGPERKRLENCAQNLGIADYVRFAGSRPDVPRMLRSIDVSVLCSSNVVETFPQSLVESMAMELPVVSTNVGSVNEVIVEGETGYLVPEGDAQALAEKIAYLLQNPDLRRKMGVAGRRRVEEQFSRDIMTRHFEDMFERLARRTEIRETIGR